MENTFPLFTTCWRIVRWNQMVIHCVFLFVFSTLSVWLLLPQIGVTDIDAYSYIVGAYSIQAGNGYTTFDGTPINLWWPPGYSLLLSLFPEPLQASLVINYISLGSAIILLYLIARKSGWDWKIAISCCLTIGFVFFRRIAPFAKPDMLTYALFLLALLFYLSANHRLYVLSYWIWSALIPLKLIAMVFTPAALICDLLLRGKSGFVRSHRIQSLSIGLGWFVSLASIFVFNYYTIDSIIVPHGKNSIRAFAGEVLRFLISVPRYFLSYWYGSIKGPWVLAFFCIAVIISIGCLITLRWHPEGKRLRNLGLLLLALSWALQIFSTFDADVRVMGYSLIVLLFAFRPKPETWKRWSLYAAFSIFLAVLNLSIVNSSGVNDPRYQKLSYELLAVGLPQEIVYTNSYHILDIHIRFPTQPIKDIRLLRLLNEGAYFLWVTLPKYDAISTTVWPIDRPGLDWCETASVEGATLFRKCVQ